MTSVTLQKRATLEHGGHARFPSRSGGFYFKLSADESHCPALTGSE